MKLVNKDLYNLETALRISLGKIWEKQENPDLL